MSHLPKIKFYSPFEEKLNITSHATGLGLSMVALVLLNIRADFYGNFWDIFSFNIFGLSLIILYSASTLYHSAKNPEKRAKLKVFDHAAIYILIAGTYTPLTLVVLKGGTLGWTLFCISWGIAITGVILKLFFTGRFSILSTTMYVLMGWIIIIAVKSLINNLPLDGLIWFISGGIFYTVGALLYSIKKIKLNHAIFHILVVIGSFCHFVTICFYSIPAK